MTDPRDIRIAELEEQVAQLRRLLRLEPERAITDAFRGHLRLSPSMATLLWTLWDAGSSWVSVERLDRALPCRDAVSGRDPRTIKMQVHHLRRRIGSGAILSHWGRGWTLSGEGFELCRAAITAAVPACIAERVAA